MKQIVIAPVATIAAAAVASVTLGDVVAAQGAITWMLYLAASQLGSAAYLARKQKSIDDRENVFIVGMRSAGWGFVVALACNGYGIRPEYTGSFVFIAGMAAAWLTEAVFVVARGFAKNPLQYIDDFRNGRALRESKKKEDE